MVEALQAHLGQDMIANLDLMLQTGLPTTVQSSLLLPVSLSGQVLFRDASEVVGTESLTRIIVNEVFEKPSALDLYLFRLRIAEDVVLTKISTVVVGDDKADSYISNLQQQSNNGSGAAVSNSDNNTDTVSLVLIIVIAAVSAAFVAVVFFAYCLLCRGGGGDDDRLDKTPALPVVDEDVDNYGGDDKTGLITSGKDSGGKSDPRNSRRSGKATSSFLRSPRLSRRSNTNSSTDDIPAVNTSETAPDIEEGYNELNTDGGDISVGISQLDDGVSEIDMDTLPPPLPNAGDDDDDDEATLESIDYTSGLVETEQFNYETDTYNPDEVSLAENSLYSYNRDDYSLVAPPSIAPTTYSKDNVQSVAMTEKSADNPSQTDSGGSGPLEKTKKKGLLWSVMDGLKSVNDGSKNQQNDGQYETSMLGPTDNDSAGNSHDSNSLLYLKEAQVAGAVPRILQYDAANDDAETITTLGDTPTNAAFYGSGKYSDKKKKQFEQLWRDEDEAEQAAAVEAHLAAASKADNNDAVTPTKEVGNTLDEAPATEKRRNTYNAEADDSDDVEDYSLPASSDDVPVVRDGVVAATVPVGPESAAAENSTDEEAASVNDESDAMQQADRDEATNIKAVECKTDEEKNVEGKEEPKTEIDAVTETSLVDRVPKEDGEEEEGENNGLPLPNALQSTLAEAKTDASDTNSVSSSHSGSSSVSSGRIGASARKKRSNWSSSCSVTSTDSAKFRALLGQSDTNDAAVVFKEQLEHQQEDMENHQQHVDDPQEDKSKVVTSEASSSSGNGQSGQLKSLLLQPTESTDSADNDYENGEDFLRSVDAEVAAAHKDAGLAATLKTGNQTSTVGAQSVSNEVGGISGDESDSDDEDVVRSQDIMRKPEEMNKEGVQDDGDTQSASYLPAAIRPVESFESKGSADGTIISVMSTVSAAPSVDETITSQMGWF